MKKSTKKVATGAVLAGAVGYVTGILTAPKSGKKTRKNIRKSSQKTKHEAEKQLKHLHTELSGLITQGKRESGRLQDKAKSELGDVLKRAQTAKEKARGVLSAMHEEGADDKELQKAITDVNQAIAHLRTYVDRQKTTAVKAVRTPAKRKPAARTSTTNRKNTNAKK